MGTGAKYLCFTVLNTCLQHIKAFFSVKLQGHAKRKSVNSGFSECTERKM
jgi:hypothetical protein